MDSMALALSYNSSSQILTEKAIELKNAIELTWLYKTDKRVLKHACLINEIC
jgi:hypothetical protein